MSNEVRILEALVSLRKDMEQRFDGIDRRLDNVEREQAQMKLEHAQMRREQSEMKATLDAIFEHTASLTERQTYTDQAIRDLCAIAKENMADIARLKAAL